MRVTWIWSGPARHEQHEHHPVRHARSSADRPPRASIDGIPEQTTCHEHPERNHHHV
jgi:hypothetical protein